MAITSFDTQTDWENEQFKNVDADIANQETQLNQTYGGMIDSSDKFYEDQIQASKDWADKQTQLQQEQTDFAIEKIEQEKDKAHKDYLKEQSGAYVDWQKQSNQYSAEAEKMASAGLSNTGFSESSQVSMYNTYQNRVSTARESYQNAVLNYNNAIKDATLQNNAALAEIAYTALQQQLELSLQGFQYKNQLVLDLTDKKMELENVKWNRYQDVLQQLNTEKALELDIQKHNDTQVFQKELAEIEHQNQLERDKIQQGYAKELEALKHDYNIKYLDAKTIKDKELIEKEYEEKAAQLEKEQQYKLDLLDKELANDKALLSYQNSLNKTAVSGGTTSSNAYASAKKEDTAYKNQTSVANTSFTGSTYEQAVAYMKSHGVPSGNASGAMTQSEWSRRRASYMNTGTGAKEVTAYSSYQAYLKDYVAYCVSTYAK